MSMGAGGHGRRGLARLAHAARYSAAGFAAAWRGEEAFRQEIVLGFVLVPAAVWLGRSAVERAALIGTWLLVLVVELLNTAVEATVDRIGHERNPLSGQAKDLGSAAVLTSLLLLCLAWGAVLIDRFWR
jgi:diacylglycerol kinase (ATP)